VRWVAPDYHGLVDPLTHSLVGAALTRTSLGRTTGLAGAALIVGANLPDIDVVSLFLGSDTGYAFRRGWTHGPLGILLLPPLWTALLVLYDRRRRRRGTSGLPAPAGRLLALTYVGCLTHPLLDWLNTYGVRLLMPFDGSWYYGDTLFIIDPWLWLILGGAAYLGSDRRGVPWGWALLATVCSAVVFAAGGAVPSAAKVTFVAGVGAIALMRQPAGSGASVRTATVGLALAVTYVAAMKASTLATIPTIRAELQEAGIVDVRRMMIGAVPANPFRRNVVVETATSYHRGRFRWLPSPTFAVDRTGIDRPPDSPLVRAAFEAPSVRGFLGWARFPFVRVEETPGGHIVHILDARYAGPNARGFGTTSVELDTELRPRTP
jgi:inner membrane protein